LVGAGLYSLSSPFLRKNKMFVFNNTPGEATNVKSVFIKFILAGAAFWLIMAFLIPQIKVEPLETIVRIAVILLSILFVVDFFI
jgi:hypothetical protein